MKSAQGLISNIIESMPSVLIGVDPRGLITHWNSRAEAMTGISTSRAEGRPVMECVPILEDDEQKLFDAMKAVRSVTIQAEQIL